MVIKLLDLAQSRGGDQVAVQTAGEDVQYFGGSSEATEKRSRVRVRVMAHTLREMIMRSSNVIICGHRNADFDCIGSAIGAARITEALHKQCCIIAKTGGIEEKLGAVMSENLEELTQEVNFVTENEALNQLQDKVEYLTADVFELLPRLEREGRQFDVVILDPPAFTKSRASVKAATRGYREINIRGMRLVKDGGYLATCSCSHFMNPELFAKTIGEAAKDAHVRLRQVEFRTQAPDHPILWSSDDSYYLKFYIFQVVRV
jgi:hypothetical protein